MEKNMENEIEAVFIVGILGINSGDIGKLEKNMETSILS